MSTERRHPRQAAHTPGIEVQDTGTRGPRERLQRLILTGNIMAEKMRQVADELERSGSCPAGVADERRLADAWDQCLETWQREGGR